MLTGAMSLVGLGSLTSSPYGDRDGDGIPDTDERSASVHRTLADIFGDDQFDGFGAERRDLLVDARYVGEATVDPAATRAIEHQFRENGIHLQWLEYPTTYDLDRFASQYGFQVERILWPHQGFYEHEVEDILKDIAIQVVVLPEDHGRLETTYAVHHGDRLEGVSFGNRCLISEQRSTKGNHVLLLHELGHLALCHNEDPDDPSVMAPQPEEPYLTEREWDELRENLDNVRDSTGFDIGYRRCMLQEYRDDLVAAVSDVYSD